MRNFLTKAFRLGLSPTFENLRKDRMICQTQCRLSIHQDAAAGIAGKRDMKQGGLDALGIKPINGAVV